MMPSKLCVVLDTNVILKGLFISTSKHNMVLDAFLGFRVRLYYSPTNMEEFSEVITYPKVQKSFDIDTGVVKMFVKKVQRQGIRVVPEKTSMCRDAKDNMMLGTAMAGAKFGVIYLVTEDEDLLELGGRIENVEIVTPGDILNVINS